MPPLLVIEDDESLRVIIARHLRSTGFDVTAVGSAEEAVAALNQGLRPAAVLLDVNLPGETGWEFLRRDDLARAGSPPVVITSATPVSPKFLAEFGCKGWLPKPFPLETLDDTLERLITGRGEQNDQ